MKTSWIALCLAATALAEAPAPYAPPPRTGVPTLSEDFFSNKAKEEPPPTSKSGTSGSVRYYGAPPVTNSVTREENMASCRQADGFIDKKCFETKQNDSALGIQKKIISREEEMNTPLTNVPARTSSEPTGEKLFEPSNR